MLLFLLNCRPLDFVSFSGVPAAAEAPPAEQMAAMNINVQAPGVTAVQAAPGEQREGGRGVRERGQRYAVSQ